MLAFNSAGWFYMKRFADPCVPGHMGSEYFQPRIRGVGAYCTMACSFRFVGKLEYYLLGLFLLFLYILMDVVLTFLVMLFCKGVTVTFG